ncbi:unnamed protein product [Periconia digitata]|uniref:Dystroglycan-type cadherin-like domain-containing protein n=1 Tax=Periconia digitata TaxID=1303443 RepID=A0A9W4UNT8_9PLEO|nr:unnamed protein product [Periconia digitata]
MARIRHLLSGLIAALTFANVVTASPQVNYPLNLQLPPVAQAGKQYNFQFASTTFQPNPDQLQYSLVGNPTWLHINSSSRTLYGTPEDNDAGIVSFSITAAGEAGAVATMESKLMVARDGPTVVGDISQQLAKAGQLTGPANLTLLPSKPFEIRFDKDIFDFKGKNVAYYATSADHTPLPSWISFNAQSLSFSGTTPYSPAPQVFNIIIIASDNPDYAETSAAFTLVISNHQLLFQPLSQTINMSKGDRVQIADLKHKLFLDNASVTDTDIQNATAKLPSWLTFDERSFEVAGLPPAGLMAQDFSITVTDRYGDVAKHTVHIAFTSKLFAAGVEPLNITAGEPFQYTIPKSILSQEGESVGMEMKELGEWLKFDPDTLSIQGTLPSNINLQDAELTMTASTSDGAVKDSQTIPVRVSTGNPGVDTGSQIADDPVAQHSSSPRKRAGIIVGSVISGLVVTTILLCLISFICRRRKKQRQGYISPKSPRSPRKSDISRPIPPVVADFGELTAAQDADLEKGKDVVRVPAPVLEPRPPPKIDLPLRNSRDHSPASFLDDLDDQILDDFNSSPHGFSQHEAGPSACPGDSMRVPNEMLRRDSELFMHPGKKRKSQVYKDANSPSHSITRHQRSVRRGPVRLTYSSSQSTNFTALRRRSLKSSSSATNTLSMASSTPIAVPQPTKNRHTTQVTTPLETQPSIRVVPEMDPPMSEKRNSWADRRHSYFSKRASSQKSPFFGGAAARSSSGSYSYNKPPAFHADTSLQQSSAKVVGPHDGTVPNGGTFLDASDTPKIRRPAETPSPHSERGEFARSLRHKRSSLIRRHMEGAASRKMTLEDVKKNIIPNPQARDLKTGLNKAMQEEIYEDSERSESQYSDEESDIEEYDNRKTITQADFVQPLDVNKIKSKKEKERRNSQRRELKLKRASEREATPYYSLSNEHGGKENLTPSPSSSIYQQRDIISSPTRSSLPKSQFSTSRSPTRPKTSIGWRSVQRSPPRVTRTFSNSSTKRRSQGRRPLSQSHLTATDAHERHSRRSIHARPHSRHSPSPATKKSRELSRSQSSSFPHIASRRRSARKEDITTVENTGPPLPNHHHRSRRSESSTLLVNYPHDRDISGNLIMHHNPSPSPSSHIALPSPPTLPPKSTRRATAAPALPTKPSKRSTRVKHHQHDETSSPFFQAKRSTVGLSSPSYFSPLVGKRHVAAASAAASPASQFPPHEPLPPTPTLSWMPVSESSAGRSTRRERERNGNSKGEKENGMVGLGVSFEKGKRSPLGAFRWEGRADRRSGGWGVESGERLSGRGIWETDDEKAML